MTNFWQAVEAHNWAPPELKLEFRLYYDDQGRVLYYSMEDLPGTYITVDRHTFEQHRFDIRIKDEKIIKQNHPSSWKLVPSDTASYSCHANDVSIVVPETYENKQHWKVETTHEAD